MYTIHCYIFVQTEKANQSTLYIFIQSRISTRSAALVSRQLITFLRAHQISIFLFHTRSFVRIVPNVIINPFIIIYLNFIHFLEISVKINPFFFKSYSKEDSRKNPPQATAGNNDRRVTGHLQGLCQLRREAQVQLHWLTVHAHTAKDYRLKYLSKKKTFASMIISKHFFFFLLNRISATCNTM